MDYRHVVFPELSTDLYRSRQQRVAQTLDQIESSLAKEKRDLKREAAGGAPVEGVGAEIADLPFAIAAEANDPVNSSAAAG